MSQKQHTRHTERQRQPKTLLEHVRHFIITPRTVQMRHHRRHRLQDANQGKHYRNMNATTNRHRRQVNSADVAENGRIHHHHANGGELSDQDG